MRCYCWCSRNPKQPGMYQPTNCFFARFLSFINSISEQTTINTEKSYNSKGRFPYTSPYPPYSPHFGAPFNEKRPCFSTTEKPHRCFGITDDVATTHGLGSLRGVAAGFLGGGVGAFVCFLMRKNSMKKPWKTPCKHHEKNMTKTWNNHETLWKNMKNMKHPPIYVSSMMINEKKGHQIDMFGEVWMGYLELGFVCCFCFVRRLKKINGLDGVAVL